MKSTEFHCLVLLLLTLLINTAKADHPAVAFGINGVGAINTISADTLNQGTFAIGLQTEFIDNDAFSSEQLEDFAARGFEGVHSLDSITNTSLSLSYGFTDKLTVSARLPFIKRRNIREGEIEGGVPEAHLHGDSSAVGDLLLLGQYRFFSNDSTNVAINFGMKLATGEKRNKDIDGILFETEFQSGSGSNDYILGVAASHKGRLFAYHSNILYNKTTEGSQDTEIGDALNYNLAITYRLNQAISHEQHTAHEHSDRLWDFMLELNGEKRGRNRIADELEQHSGGNVLLLSPGIRMSVGKFSAYFSYGIPIIEDQNGEQTDIKQRVVTGFSYAF